MCVYFGECLTSYSFFFWPDKGEMYSAVRVLIFLFGIFIIPSILVIIPLYLRHKTFADVVFAVTESDVREIKDGISTLFCQVNMVTKFQCSRIGLIEWTEIFLGSKRWKKIHLWSLRTRRTKTDFSLGWMKVILGMCNVELLPKN